jgi:hypothetical protein
MADKTDGDANGDAAQEKRARHRSPNYPVIGLEKALERAKTIKEKALRHFISVKSAHEAWDYKSGVGDQVVAALKAFGLIEVQGAKDKRQLRLTESAWRILGNAPDKAEQIEKAALNPEIHKEIWDKYEGPPPSDAVLRDYLLWEREHKFNESTVEGFIAQFRGTIAFAGFDLSDKLSSDDVSNPKNKVDPPMRQEPPVKPPSQNPFVQFRHLDGTSVEYEKEKAGRAIAAEWSLNISRDSVARVVIYGKPSQEAIDKLSDFVELQKDTFPTAAEIVAAAEIAALEGYRAGVSENELEREDSQAKGAA